jgi:hypothetical protein
MDNSEELPEDFTELAQEYYEVVISEDNSKEGVDNDQEVQVLEREIESINEDLDDYADDNPLYSVLKEEHGEKMERLESIQSENQRKKLLKSEFSKRIVTDFATKQEMLTDRVIQSVSHSLTGQSLDELYIGRTRLDSESELDRPSIIETTKSIHKLAEYHMGEDEYLKEIWDDLSDREISIINVLSSAHDEIGPTEIANRLEEDVTKGAVSPVLGEDSDREFPFTHKGDDGYRLTIVGDYLCNKSDSDNEEDQDRSEMSNVTEF